MKPDNNQIAKEFVSLVKKYGWNIILKSNSVIAIHKTFTPGDKVAFSNADMEAYGLLGMLPLKGGSVWGTDGGSIGGQVGLNGGYYTLNKSGSNGTRLFAAIKKIVSCRVED